jgi:hypothetical protein
MATPSIRNLNEYKTKMLQINAQQALADNDLLVITGISGGDAANTMLMIDSALIKNTIDELPENFTGTRESILENLLHLSGNKKN